MKTENGPWALKIEVDKYWKKDTHNQFYIRT